MITGIPYPEINWAFPLDSNLFGFLSSAELVKTLIDFSGMKMQTSVALSRGKILGGGEEHERRFSFLEAQSSPAGAVINVCKESKDALDSRLLFVKRAREHTRRGLDVNSFIGLHTEFTAIINGESLHHKRCCSTLLQTPAPTEATAPPVSFSSLSAATTFPSPARVTLLLQQRLIWEQRYATFNNETLCCYLLLFCICSSVSGRSSLKVSGRNRLDTEERMSSPVSDDEGHPGQDHVSDAVVQKRSQSAEDHTQ
ncbi:hypothetical protein DNTS_031148 [Danionella cerebrum]|uniref:Uncharacterized protein n=1 Tax=Danionella cerebrum TaxID=2873325 RepID=A0A553MLN2_9TELE|nr:hypothetical protein DNTS_031148 [Danionella translucida]